TFKNVAVAPQPDFPAGFNPKDGPAGVTFSGRAFSEARLIGLAYAFEQVTHHRFPPASAPAFPSDTVIRQESTRIGRRASPRRSRARTSVQSLSTGRSDALQVLGHFGRRQAPLPASSNSKRHDCRAVGSAAWLSAASFRQVEMRPQREVVILLRREARQVEYDDQLNGAPVPLELRRQTEVDLGDANQNCADNAAAQAAANCFAR